MKKISFILIMAMISTYTVYAVPWTANNAVEIEPSVMVEISCNDNFSINGDTEPDFKGAYGTAGYRGYSTGYNINIKDAVTQNTGRDINPLLPVETIDDAHGLSLKLEPNDTSKLNNLIFSIARFKIDDMETERSDYDLGGYNRVINKDTPFVKADCPVSVKFDVYRPQNSTMSEIQFNARPMPPTKDTFYTYQTYLDAGSPNFAKVSIEKMAKDQLSAGEWVTIEKVFRFSDYAALKNGIDNGGYIAFEISPIFEAADNPVVYVDNFKVSYTSPSVYQTPDTNMISQIKISDGYRNSKWITEDTDVSYGDGSFSYKFIPHDGYPRSGDNARFDNNYYRDLNMKFSDNIDVKNNRKYRFSCWVKADTSATLINGAYLRLYKNTTVELMGITNEIVADGQWHELIYDFSGQADLSSLVIGVGKNSREAFVNYDEETGAISEAETITFHVANPKVSVLPIYLEVELIKQDAQTAVAVIQNLSPEDTLFKGVVIVGEYTPGGALIQANISKVNEMLEAYEGRAAVRVKLDNIGSGNVIKAFLWESMEALSQILPAVVEEQNN